MYQTQHGANMCNSGTGALKCSILNTV